ncbi:MAG: mechanosensitive ion channel family protein [Bacillota bacterium]
MKIAVLELWHNQVFREYLLPIAGYLVAAFIGIKIGDFIINKIFRPREKLYFDERRVNTMRTLLRSVLRYAVYFILIFMILETTVKDIKGFLAGAGIIGVALGFGAQSLVRDVITGFFILFENQYAVGEYVTIGNLSGFVEEMELRVTKLRDWGGEMHFIPNGQVTTVTNFSRGSMRALVEISIAYEEEIDRALSVLKREAAEIAGELKEVVEEGPEVLGVVALGPSEVVIRVVAKTKPMEQWAVEREMRKRFKAAFDREGIEIPYPKRVMITPLGNNAPGPGRAPEKLKAPE